MIPLYAVCVISVLLGSLPFRSVYIVLIIVTICLLSSMYAPPSSRQTPCWSKILLGNKSVSDSDSDDSKIKPSQLQSCVNVSRWHQ